MDEVDDIPYGLCQCGCGKKTTVAPQNVARNGYVKGEPRAYRTGHNPGSHKLTAEEKRAYTRRYRRENPEKVRLHKRRSHLKMLYGLTLEAYDALLEGQGGTCATCDRRASQSGRSLHVDHDHATGKVRGILCHNCNLALGKAGESPAQLRALANYLERK